MNLLTQMASFARIVELGSLSSAARAQGLSLPAISRQLSELERELGAPLVLRSTRRLSITPSGRAFYDHSVRILREIEEARQSVNPSGVRGTLVVSAGVTIGANLVLACVPDLRQKCPDLVLELRLEDHVVDLLAQGVDVAVRGGVPLPDSAGLIAQPVLRFQRVLVAARSYLRQARTPKDPSLLAKHDCLLQVGPGGPVREWNLRRGEEQRKVGVLGHCRSSAPLALREAARAGLGVALLPLWLVQADVEAGDLVRVLKGWESEPISIFAIYRVEQRNSAAIRAFTAALRGVAAGDAEKPD
jgi:DNA-binding transcriptional LysR family regulator